MDKLQQAIAGQTVTMTIQELFCKFLTEADLRNWANTYGLDFTNDPATGTCKIFKAQ